MTCAYCTKCEGTCKWAIKQIALFLYFLNSILDFQISRILQLIWKFPNFKLSIFAKNLEIYKYRNSRKTEILEIPNSEIIYFCRQTYMYVTRHAGVFACVFACIYECICEDRLELVYVWTNSSMYAYIPCM